MTAALRPAPEPGLLWLPLLAGAGAIALTAGAGAELPALLLPAAALGAVAALVIALGTAQGSALATGALLALTLVGLSLTLRQRDYGETGLDWQNGAKLVVWLMIPLLALFRLRRIGPMLADPVLALGLAYGGVATLSALWSATPAYTAANGIGFIAYLLLGVMAVAALGRQRAIRLATLTLLAFILMALAASLLLPEMAWLPPSPEEAGYRLRGLSGHPNVLGQQAALLVLLALAARRIGTVSLAVMLAAVTSGLVALWLTGSRTTLAATLAAAGLLWLREHRILLPALWLIAAGVLAGLFLAALGLFPDLQATVGQLSRSGSIAEVTTLTGRTDLWAVTLDIIAERPLLGWGFNGTEALIVGSVGRAFEGDPVNAHNMLLQSLLGLGLLGSLPGFAMLALLARRFVLAPDPLRDRLLLLILIVGCAEVGLFATPVMLTLVTFLAVAASLDQHAEAGR